MWWRWRTQRALECHSQWHIPSADTIHFASPLQLISLLCVPTSWAQHSAAQGCFVLAFLEAGLNTLLIIFLSHNFWGWWCNQCDKDSGAFPPQGLNHFLVARSPLMEGLNIPKAPGDLSTALFWSALKMTAGFKTYKDSRGTRARALLGFKRATHRKG